MGEVKKIEGDSIIDRILKESLEIRLQVHFYIDYITNINPKDGDNTMQDNVGARKYEKRNTKEVMEIVKEWVNDGMPK